MKKHIRIIAPSSALPKDNEQKLAQMVAFLQDHDFEVSYPNNLFANPPLPFNSNIREIRLAHLKDAIEDPKVDIIWAFRGGNGAAELAIPAMKFIPARHPGILLAKYPGPHEIPGQARDDGVGRYDGKKILIGFSDITSLHLLFNEHYNLPSIHGPVLTSLLDKHPNTIHQIKDILDGKKQSLKLEPLNNAAESHKDIKTIMIGGNLTVFCSMFGTQLSPVLANRILVLEDFREDGYKVRRCLTQIEQSSHPSDLVACIFGDFTECGENIEWALKDFAARNPKLPIFKASGIGHGLVNIPLVFGTEASIP